MSTSNDWYVAWVGHHAKATAACNMAVLSLLENESIAVEVWEACADELRECTRRLIATCRTPKFPNEHVDAIGTELVHLRKERQRDGFMVPDAPQNGECPMRCENGLLFAPLPEAVRESGGTPRADWSRRTCVVICDQCSRGKAEAAAQDRVEAFAAPEEKWKSKKLPKLSKYYEQTHGYDAITALREFQKRTTTAYQIAVDAGLPNLAAMLAKSFRVPPKPHAPGPAAIPA